MVDLHILFSLDSDLESNMSATEYYNGCFSWTEIWKKINSWTTGTQTFQLTGMIYMYELSLKKFPDLFSDSISGHTFVIYTMYIYLLLSHELPDQIETKL